MKLKRCLFSLMAMTSLMLLHHATMAAHVDYSTLATSMNKFSHNLLMESLGEGDKNVCLSGLSVHHALSIPLMGTGKDSSTRKHMMSVLHLQGDDPHNFVGHFGNMISSLSLLGTKTHETIPESPTLAIASHVATFHGIPVRTTFLHHAQNMGGQYTTYEKSCADNIIINDLNTWFSEHTHKKIQNVLNRIETDEFLAVLNAVYFKGAWSGQFSERATAVADFAVNDTKKKPVSMMKRTGGYRYLADQDGQILEMDYAGADFGNHKPRFSMFFFLPKQDKKLAAAISDFDLNKLARVANSDPKNGTIAIPKFKIEIETSMKDTLKKMGMTNVFENADFSNMADGPVSISRVIHKTFIDVNELGTEAAGATVVLMQQKCVMRPPREEFTFTADRPFFFFIRDNQQGVILFEGLVVDP